MSKHEKLHFKRARQPEQIEYRREEILRSALIIFRQKGLENVTLTDIAQEVGTVKSNLYRYFDSREHIYLNILQRQGDAWEKRITSLLEKLAGKGTIAKVANVITEAFMKSEDYCQLSTVVNSLLEKNLTPKHVINFRSVSFERRKRFAHILAAALPNTSIEIIFPLTLPIFAQMVVLWSLGHPPPGPKKLLEKPEFAHLNHNFKKEMSRVIELILKGALGCEKRKAKILPGEA